MAGTVVKCIFAFTGEVDTDLSLDVGDLIKITKVLSDDWYEGTCNGRNGQFPKAFVEKTSEVFEMALAITHFPGEEKGDLPLNEGDVVIITEIIDDNWAVGHTHGGHKGTFPRAFVKEISFEDSVMKNALQAAVEPMETAVEENSDVSVEQEECNDGKYTVISPFSAQAETELELKVGMIVEVLNVYDDFWLEGALSDSKQGIFPRTCIDFPDDKMPDFGENEKQSAPESSIKEELTLEKVKQEDETDNNSTNEEFLHAIYDYNSGVEGDLSFEIGDGIKLIEVIDENWYKGEFHGKTGVFPSNHVEKAVNENDPQDDDSLKIPEGIESDNVSTDSFPPPPPEEVLSDIEENVNKDIWEQEKAKVDLTDIEQPPQKPTRKPAPSRPAAGPKRPQKPANKPSIQQETIEPIADKLPEKPKKKAPPERPKMPTVKKDIPAFSYTFSTESQPTVIIPGYYVKPGEPNIIILRRSVPVS